MQRIGTLSLAAGALVAVAVAASYEPHPVFKASEILPKPLVPGRTSRSKERP
jgi:hypothetical protein